VTQKIWILAAVFAAVIGCGTAAQATCPSPFTVKDSTGTTQNLAEINDASNSCVFPNAITDGGGAANRAAVKAASTSPAETDPALVVGVSPNSLGCAGTSIANTTATPISITANTQIITGTSSKQTYVCYVNLVVSAADNVALVEGTGSTCGTGTAGMAGGSTAAAGWNFAANGGLTMGDGRGNIIRTATAADNVCLLVSSGAQVSGTIVWAQF
jgi:hypothetical protein